MMISLNLARETLEKSIDTGGLQQVLSGEDQSEVPKFSKALSMLAQNRLPVTTN
jgi:hypothetical protein